LSTNRGKPHLLIVPEDDHDRAIALGALGALNINAQVMGNARGWRKVEALLNKQYIPRLRTNANTHVVIVIDFDGQGKRRYEEVSAWVPSGLQDRVFILGPAKEPKDLKQAIPKKSYAQIGETLVSDCDEQQIHSDWNDEMLQHNKPEFRRLLYTIGLKLLNS